MPVSVSIDTSAAEGMPGVHGIYTNEQMVTLAEPLGGSGTSGDAELEEVDTGTIPIPVSPDACPGQGALGGRTDRRRAGRQRGPGARCG